MSKFKDLTLLLLAISGWVFFYNKPYELQFIPYPERKPFIVEYKNDCYASKDFTHEILSAKDTQELLKQLNDRKLK